VLVSLRGCLGCVLCQKRLRLSWKLDECKPLPECLLLQKERHVVAAVQEVFVRLRLFLLMGGGEDGGCEAEHQGLTFVHFSAQLEPFLTHNTP